MTPGRSDDRVDAFIFNAFGWMIGKKISSVRELTEDEYEQMGWSKNTWSIAVAMVFDDGTFMIPVSDPEMNNPGWVISSHAQNFWGDE